ncbi:MAG: DUF3450 domain-containing protein [Rhodothalassiaceae bacterium]
MKHNRIRHLVLAAAAFGMAAVPTAMAQEEPADPAPPPRPIIEDPTQLNRVFDEAREINQLAQASQEEINDLSSETSQLVVQYDRLLKQLEGIRAFNAQQERLIQAQQQEIAEYEQSIIDVQAVRRQITPLMLRMIGAIERFVDLDMPFLLEQRRERVEGLRDLMDRSDVSEAEKFRRVFEVYQIENEYGRTIGTYPGEVTVDGAVKTVDFLRIGRIILAYESQDATEVGFFNPVTEQFEPLPPAYRNTITAALRYANRQASPEIYALPINGPEPVQ